MRSVAILISTLFLMGCNSPVETKREIDQHLTLQVRKFPAHFEDSVEVMPTRLFITGNLFSLEPNDIQYLGINSDTISGAECSRFRRKGLEIQHSYYWNKDETNGSLDSLSVMVSSELGSLEGYVELPSKPDQIQLSESDSIESGTTFTISWNGEECDFYMIQTNYSWSNSERAMYYDFLYHYSEGTTLTYPDSTFRYDGEIHAIRVTPVNGPRPSYEMVPNMVGQGDGYLYYPGLSTGIWAGIIVGREGDSQQSKALSGRHENSDNVHRSQVFNGTVSQKVLLERLAIEMD